MLTTTLLSSLVFAELEKEEPLWEFGVGFGHVTVSEYPAADENRSFTLPFPTFQYRGYYLQADDREGAHIYLWRGTTSYWNISGTGFTGLDKGQNSTRDGMAALPWVGAVGPQYVYRWINTELMSLETKIGFYQAMASDFSYLRPQGQVFDVKIDFDYQLTSELVLSVASVTRWVSQDFASLYFDIATNDVRSDRTFYKSKEGFLSTSLSTFLALSRDRWGYYAGMQFENFVISANRASPLHRSDLNTNFLIGLTYDLYKSEKLTEEDPLLKTK